MYLGIWLIQFGPFFYVWDRLNVDADSTLPLSQKLLADPERHFDWPSASKDSLEAQGS